MPAITSHWGICILTETNIKLAGAYYDSTLTNMVEKTKPFVLLKKSEKT